MAEGLCGTARLFVRLAEPDKHLEAITSRPQLLAGIAERTCHRRQTTLHDATPSTVMGVLMCPNYNMGAENGD